MRGSKANNFRHTQNSLFGRCNFLVESYFNNSNSDVVKTTCCFQGESDLAVQADWERIDAMGNEESGGAK